MNRVLWDTIFLITGSLFTFVAGQGHSTIANSSIITPNATYAPNISTSVSTTPATTTTITANSTTGNSTGNSTSNTTSNTTIITSTIKIPPVKKLVAAPVHSHFDDCPDSHSHFCFHGTCRFLILEETPACICHSGFIGMRCEHADLLAVVATNHRPQTAATALVLCVIGCVMTMLFCSLLHCWWRRDCHRRSQAFHYASEKPSAMVTGRVSFCHPESVV